MQKQILECEFYSFGTTKLFEKRMKIYGARLKRLTFLGLLSPVLLGGFVAAFSTESDILKAILIPLCSCLTIFQAVVSLMSLSYKWDEKYSYAIVAVKDNTRLTNEFNKIKYLTGNKLKQIYKPLREDYDRQNVSDMAQGITDKENRFAMRQSLFHFKSECKTCKKTPSTLKATNCDTCGNY